MKKLDEKECQEQELAVGLTGALKYALWIMTHEFGYSQGKLSDWCGADEKTLAKIKRGVIADRTRHVKGVSRKSAEYFVKKTLLMLDKKAKGELAAGRSPGHYYALCTAIAKCTYGISTEMPSKKKWKDEG